MKNLLLALLAGVVAGFAFAAGSSIESRVENRVVRKSTQGAGTVGADTANAQH